MYNLYRKENWKVLDPSSLSIEKYLKNFKHVRRVIMTKYLIYQRYLHNYIYIIVPNNPNASNRAYSNTNIPSIWIANYLLVCLIIQLSTRTIIINWTMTLGIKLKGNSQEHWTLHQINYHVPLNTSLIRISYRKRP